MVGRETERKKEREIDRVPSVGLPCMGLQSRAGPDVGSWEQETQSSSLTCVVWSQLLEPSPAAASCVSRKLELGSRAGNGTQAL